MKENIENWLQLFLDGQADLAYQLFVSDPKMQVNRLIALVDRMIELAKNKYWNVEVLAVCPSMVFTDFKFSWDIKQNLAFYWSEDNNYFVGGYGIDFLIHRSPTGRYTIIRNCRQTGETLDSAPQKFLEEIMESWCQGKFKYL